MTTLIKDELSRLNKYQERMLTEINVVTKSQVEKIWGIQYKGSPKNHFDHKRALIEILEKENINLGDYYIIYLAGLSITEQKRRLKKRLKIDDSGVGASMKEKNGRGGYYLIKKEDDLLKNRSTRRQEIPFQWRRANLREMVEIFSIHYILEKESFYPTGIYCLTRSYYRRPNKKITTRENLCQIGQDEKGEKFLIILTTTEDLVQESLLKRRISTNTILIRNINP
ncbi:MAG: hypothetical protein WC928_03680 [Patescibacteria group bacterium]|jgi:hypothetical protein